MTVKKLNILTIRLDGGTQPRLHLDQELVKEYAEKMKEGVEFPPIVVFNDGSDIWLADGFNRYHATKANGSTTIECEVRTGTLREAQLYAWGANNQHGKPLSNDDKRHIIITMLNDEEWKEWSNNKIAEVLHISSMTVARVRIMLQDEAKKNGKEPTERKYQDRYGNEVTMKTDNIGKKPRKTTKPDVTTADPNQELIEKVGELTDTINSLADENTLLRDKIAIGQWDATEIEKIDAEETIVNLREQIRILEIDNKNLRESRDMYQARNAELMRTVKGLQLKLKKLETA